MKSILSFSKFLKTKCINGDFAIPPKRVTSVSPDTGIFRFEGGTPRNALFYTLCHPYSVNYVEEVAYQLTEKHDVNVLFPSSSYDDFYCNIGNKNRIREEKVFVYKDDEKSIQSVVDDFVDFVVVMGGDGSVLYFSHLFEERELPPIFGIHPSSSTGFLLPFKMESTNFEEAVDEIVNSQCRVLQRMRLKVDILDKNGEKKQERTRSVQNEVFLFRSEESPIELELFIDDIKITSVLKGDGINVCTSSGTGGYNLSLGASVMSPKTNAIQISPINNFVPLGMPQLVIHEDSNVRVKVSERSRSKAKASFDAVKGDSVFLDVGDELLIQKSEYPVKMFIQQDENDEWLSKLYEKISHRIED